MELLAYLFIGCVVIMLFAEPKATLGFLFSIWMLTAIGMFVARALHTIAG